MSRPIVSPVGQSATFVELFFDLVFVFGVTQLVGLLHDDLSWAGAGKAVLVFWLVWWAWTQFTWALNAADTTHPFIELGTLVATAIAFFMAVTIPGAYDDASFTFAITYAGVRVVGLALYMWVGSSNPDQGQAVRSFAALSVGGLGSALLGGYLGGEAQVYLWSMTIFLDLVAAMIAADSEQWHLNPEHFAERHGLIVIIALGESLIVAAGALVASFGGEVLLVAILAVLITCGLWWTYFPLAKPELEHALEAADERTRSNLARDAFSIAHFPMLCGVIAYAVGLEDALTHPTVPLPGGPRLAIALGLFLFVGGTAIAQWRATCGSPLRRVVICGLTSAAIYLVASVPPLGTLGIALVGVGAIGFGDELKAQRLRAA